jgi:hypothetical protein
MKRRSFLPMLLLFLVALLAIVAVTVTSPPSEAFDDEGAAVTCFGTSGVCDKTMADVLSSITLKTDQLSAKVSAHEAAITAEENAAAERETARHDEATRVAEESRAVEVWSAASWQSQYSRDTAQEAQALRDIDAARDIELARVKADVEKAARDKAMQDQAKRDQADRDKAIREQSERDKAIREQATRDKEVRDKELRDMDRWAQEAAEAARQKAIRDAAAAEAARQQAIRAAAAEAARQQAERNAAAARQQAERNAAAARWQRIWQRQRQRQRPPPKKKCFPADATVVLESGATTRMDALRVGDRVQALAPDGTLAFQPVYLFGHQSASLTSEFVGVLPAGNDRATLWLTPDHYLPVVPGAAPSMSPASDPACFASPALSCARNVPAGWVKPGDVVFVAPGNVCSGGGAQKLEPVAVASVTRERKAGLYNPYTTGGWIIVDGAAASSHSDFLLEPVTPDAYKHLLPAVYQTLFAPLRALYAAVPSAFVLANAAAQAAHADGWNGLSVTQIVRIGATSIGAALYAGAAASTKLRS